MRACFFSFLLTCIGCSDSGMRSGNMPEAADFLPTVVDPGYSAASDGEQPQLVLRCEEGRLSAYLVMQPADEVDSAGIGARAVAVRLDSAPEC